MTPTLPLQLVEVRALNQLLRGARIQSVLTGPDEAGARLVIETDRAHPDVGGAYTVQVVGTFEVRVEVSVVRRMGGDGEGAA